MWSIYHASPVLPDIGLVAPRSRRKRAEPSSRHAARKGGCPGAVTPKSQAAPARVSPTLSALYRPAALARLEKNVAAWDRTLSTTRLAALVSASPRPSLVLQERALGLFQDILTQLADLEPRNAGFATQQRQRALLLAYQRRGAPATPALPAPWDATRLGAASPPAVDPAAAQRLAPLGPPCPIARGFVRTLTLALTPSDSLGPHPKVRTLVTGEGRRYLISPSLARGQAKRFCVGTTPEGAPVAVWQFLPHISMPHIQVELANIKRLCPAIDLVDVISAEPGIFAMVTLLDGGCVTAAMAKSDELGGPVIAHYVLARTAAQMAAIHAHGFVHGDVKPDNVLFGSQGQLVLSDLDLARPLDAQQEADTHHAGTYLAPEVWMQTRIGPPIDVWAWGASAGDLYLGAACNPHRYMRSNNNRIDARASRRESWSFLHWRARLLDDDGHLDPRRIGHDRSVWSRYYAQLYKVAPVLTQFVLRYALEGDPTKRIDAQTAHAFGDVLCQADQKNDLDGARQLRALAPHTPIASWVCTLAQIHRATSEQPHERHYPAALLRPATLHA